MSVPTSHNPRLGVGDLMRFAAAIPVLVVLDVMVRLLGVRRTRRLLSRLIPLRTHLAPETDTDWTRTARVALALDRAGARACRWSGRCLRRSLALWAWLRLHGIDAEVHLGVRREGQGLTGHAWVSSAGRLVAEPEATMSDQVGFGDIETF